MAQDKRCRVAELVGELCVEYDHGERVYAVVRSALGAGDRVVLDFAGVDVFASPFFNAAVGQLVKDYEPSQLNKQLSFENLSSAGQSILKRSIANAKEYYESPSYRKAVDDVLHDSSEGEL